jgi:3-deoxy-D-manno-octulosonic-acid transferase
MHCASLGEFEQGRPVLEEIRRRRPELLLVLTFYSPSGYLQRRDYKGADYVAYLPPDSARNARNWTDTLRPQLIIFVKYDFWPQLLLAAARARIPLYLIAAHFRAEQWFFRPWAGFSHRLLDCFTHLYLQDSSSEPLLDSIGIHRHSVAGDPRADRVLSIAAQRQDYPLIAGFSCRPEQRLLIAGSTWPADDAMLLDWAHTEMPPQWKLLLVPHETDEQQLQSLTAAIRLPWLRYTQAASSRLADARVMILDTMGMLSQIYRYGHIAYVGGGFGAGVHNTLEPAAHGLPVIFGPRHQKFIETARLQQQGGGFALQRPQDFAPCIRALLDDAPRHAAGRAARTCLETLAGATARIVEDILPDGPKDATNAR